MSGPRSQQSCEILLVLIEESRWPGRESAIVVQLRRSHDGPTAGTPEIVNRDIVGSDETVSYRNANPVNEVVAMGFRDDLDTCK